MRGTGQGLQEVISYNIAHNGQSTIWERDRGELGFVVGESPTVGASLGRDSSAVGDDDGRGRRREDG